MNLFIGISMKLFSLFILLLLPICLYAVKPESIKEPITVGDEVTAGVKKLLVKIFSSKAKRYPQLTYASSTHDSLNECRRLLAPHKCNFTHDVV